MQMSNRVYNILKWVAQCVLPALGTLYFALAGIWGLPYVEEVLGTITAVDTFLGVILGISTAQYHKNLTK
jgi:DMSO reductase anchor subunit